MTTWKLILLVVVFFACLANLGLLYISERKHGEAVDRYLEAVDRYLEAVLRYQTAVKMERLQRAVHARIGEEE